MNNHHQRIKRRKTKKMSETHIPYCTHQKSDPKKSLLREVCINMWLIIRTSICYKLPYKSAKFKILPFNVFFWKNISPNSPFRLCQAINNGKNYSNVLIPATKDILCHLTH